MSTQVPLDVQLKPIDHDARPLGEWLTNFPIAAVVLDPYTHESAWILDTARRVLEHFRPADVRVTLIVAGDDEEAKAFLGPITKEFFVLCDPDRAFVKAAELESLPALIHVAQEGSIVGKAEGWNPLEWRDVTKRLALRLHWSAPHVPGGSDPRPYPGSPALAET
ncbi:MAG: hypothetical protein WC184_08700 [Acidimicrobiia bacterium]